MKKLLILLFVLPFLFACTDTSSSPTPEKKAEKPAPEKPAPKPACESNNDCPNGKICVDGNCVECACADDCAKEGYGCFSNMCGCGSAGNICMEGQICVNGACEQDPTHVISCGDGIVEGNEECDGGPGCNADCTFANN